MGKIVLLDDLTINKIAAGEVIERPASVVKEMVENSIDAGAKNITVEIKNGGISLIKIIDDGCGLAEDDMEIAFERHATSKIRKADDLETVTTMGFRGEALASVAAIANIEMISKRPEDEIGHKLVIEGGKVLEKSEIGSPNGTQITVRNLFYNTPVRYKFLKKDFTESGYIEDAISRLALINKDVSLKLINSGKTVIQTNGNDDIKAVVYSIYGKDVANGITEVEYAFEDMKVTGVIGRKDIARSNRNGQVFFVNNRYVKDKNLSAAVDQAYRDILPAGKYGFVILNLELDPKKVDVNVHPAKLEVRFEEESNVFKAIYHAIKSGLEVFVAEENAKSEIESQENILDEENLEKPNTEKTKENEPEEFKPRAGTFSGFFKKLISEKEETPEELENNSLREIYESRNNFKERLKDDFERTKNEEEIKKAGVIQTEDGDIEPVYKKSVDENIEPIHKKAEEDIELAFKELAEISLKSDIRENNTKETKTDEDIKASEIKINENIEKVIDSNSNPQEVKLGNTIISNDTMESDYSLNDILKGETVKIATTKLIENSKTEVIDSLKKIDEKASQETIILKSIENEELPKETEDLEENDIEKIEEKDKNSSKENTVNSETVTEKLLKQKIELDIDDTQFIDTNKVRDSLAKVKEEAPVTPEFANMYKQVFGSEVSDIRKEKEEENTKLDVSSALQFVEKEENLNVFEQEENENLPKIKYRFVGVIFNSYAIIEVNDEMYMIEKTAAEERLTYERIKQNYYDDENKDTQMLLLADIVTLTGKEMSIARNLLDMFRKAGFDYEEFGESTIKLVSVPSWAETMNTKKLFIDIINEMDSVALTEKEENDDEFIYTIASKAISQSSSMMSDSEIEELVKDLLCLPSPFIYPSGKLTAMKITKANMEKKFSRR